VEQCFNLSTELLVEQISKADALIVRSETKVRRPGRRSGCRMGYFTLDLYVIRNVGGDVVVVCGIIHLISRLYNL
jgi:hypothetical protein